MSVTYYSPVESGGVVYSCDMVRLKFHIDALDAQAFLDWFARVDLIKNFYYDTWKSTKLGSYQLLFSCSYTNLNIKDRISTFVVGYGLNEASRVDGANCMIEFNPNKNDMSFMKELLTDISMFVKRIEGHKFHLMRYDLAVDIPIKRENVVLVKQGKREYHRIISSSLTEYFGKRNSNGFTKVYDKGVESGLDDDLTRIEITCNSLDTFPLPQIQLLQSVDDDFSDLNSTDIVLINLIRRLDYDEQQLQLKMLGRTKREKLRQYIFPYQQDFEFDMSAIHWVTVWIEEIMRCWHVEYMPDREYEIEKEIDNNDEVHKQYNIFDK